MPSKKNIGEFLSMEAHERDLDHLRHARASVMRCNGLRKYPARDLNPEPTD